MKAAEKNENGMNQITSEGGMRVEKIRATLESLKEVLIISWRADRESSDCTFASSFGFPPPFSPCPVS